jgi:hypothetical protein
MNIQLTKKNKYALQSVFSGIFIYLVSTSFPLHFSALFLLSLVMATLGSLLIHYPNVRLTNLFYSILLPFHLILGSVLFLESFPNLSSIFRVAVVIGFGALYYIVSLVDNIFLVVHDREELIPLYRAAVTWGLILIIILAIPLFAGVMKLDLLPYAQSALITIFSFLFSLYQIWSFRFDQQARSLQVGERLLYSSLVAFLIFGSSMATAFIPTESFLRALFLATILMFGLGYISAHLKNEVKRRLLMEYAVGSILFLVLMLLFSP